MMIHDVNETTRLTIVFIFRPHRHFCQLSISLVATLFEICTFADRSLSAAGAV